jgi:hypothetical protein
MFEERGGIPETESIFEAPRREVAESPKPPVEEQELPEVDDSSEEQEMVLVPYDVLPVEEQQKITDRVLDGMRGVLRDIPDYAIFASTAMYLQGKRMRALKDPGAGEFLKVAPGDLDIAVASRASLDRIRQRMANMPGVQFNNEGKYKQLPGERNLVLSGSVLVRERNAQGQVHDVKYDFEFFNESRIVTEDAFRKRTQIEGVSVLSLEGLKSQYLNNLSLETKIDRNVQDKVAFLTGDMLRQAQDTERRRAIAEGREPEELVLPEGWVDPDQIRSEVRSGKIGAEVAELLDRLGLQEEFVKRFYDVQKKIDAEPDEKKRQELITQRSVLLSGPGLKTKIPKREESIQKIKRAEQIEL